MALLTATAASSAGVNTAGAAAAGGGDTFVNTGKELLMVNNGGGGAVNVTLSSPITVDGQAVADRVINVPAGERRLIGPLKPGVYNDTGLGGGIVSVTYDGVTSVTVAVISVTPVG